MKERLLRRFILWAIKRNDGLSYSVVTFGGSRLFYRYEPFGQDEWGAYKLPWWKPVNALLHRWVAGKDQREAMHDHPRWSITVCLRGKIIERTPWGERTLTPGSVVIRSRKAIHSFEVPDGYRGKTWTLFIVGRRKHRQNTYEVTAR